MSGMHGQYVRVIAGREGTVHWLRDIPIDGEHRLEKRVCLMGGSGRVKVDGCDGERQACRAQWDTCHAMV